MWYMSAMALLNWLHGRSPVAISTTVQPTDHTSALRPNDSWQITFAAESREPVRKSRSQEEPFARGAVCKSREQEPL